VIVYFALDALGAAPAGGVVERRAIVRQMR
jgi:hypothetical protein